MEADLEAMPEVRSYHRWWLTAYIVAWLYTWRRPLGLATIQETSDLPPAYLLTSIRKPDA